MSRILIPAGRVKVRGEKCTEKHYSDTYNLSKKRQKDVRNENEKENENKKVLPESNIRGTSADNETTNDDVFHDLTQTSDIPLHSIRNTNIITKNFEISSEHNHTMKSIKKILESVPKSYHTLKHTY